MKTLHLLGQILIGYIIGATSVCEQIPFEVCRRVLPYNQTSYPNYLGHTSSARAISLYSNSLEIYAVLGCHKLLVYLVCNLVSPKCDAGTGALVPPCRELCFTVQSSCMGHPTIDCSNFPTIGENPSCVSVRMAELTTTPPPVVTTTMPTTLPPSRITWPLPDQNQTKSTELDATMAGSQRLVTPSSETEVTVTFKTQGPDVEVNVELDTGNSYESSARIILGVSIGTLVTMVMLVTTCVCCRFYTQCKSPNARARPVPETYSGFYANPAFENSNGNELFTQPAGSNQGGAVVNSNQTNTQIAAELAVTQLPPHPASRPLHTLPVCAPGPAPNGTASLEQAPYCSNKTATLPNNSSIHQPAQRRNTLPANASPGISRRNDHIKIPDTALDVPLSLKAGSLPPEKVIENAGPHPYQEGGSLPHYCTLGRSTTANKSPKRFSRPLSIWRRSSHRNDEDVAPNPSSPEGTPSRYPGPSQDLVFANPAAKDEDTNKCSNMTEINLNEENLTTIEQSEEEVPIDNRFQDEVGSSGKEKMVENCSPVFINMSNNKQ